MHAISSLLPERPGVTLRLKMRKELPERDVTRRIRNQKCGVRLEESFLYIAEIVSHFDWVAIQAVIPSSTFYAIDASCNRDYGNYMIIQVPFEQPRKPVPVGSYVAVVDYDAVNRSRRSKDSRKSYLKFRPRMFAFRLAVYVR